MATTCYPPLLAGAVILIVATITASSDPLPPGGMAEVKLGELAERSGQSDVLKGFAMVSDHSKANDKFADIARKQGLNLPEEIDPEHQAMSQKLEDLRGRKFDTEYMKAQVADPQKTAQLLEYEIDSGQNAAVKDSPPVRFQSSSGISKMAQGVMAELTGQAAR
jgi:putative membrane protein